MLSIHTIQESDLFEIAGLETQIQRHSWTLSMLQACLTESSYRGYVIKEPHVLAYIITQEICEDLHLLLLGVAPNARRMGYAKKLIHWAWDKRDATCNRYLLEVAESNIPAIRLYQNLGFSEIGRRKNYYGTETALVYAKN